MDFKLAKDVMEYEIEKMRVGDAYVALNYSNPPDELHFVVQPTHQPLHVTIEYVFTWAEGADMVQMDKVRAWWDGAAWRDTVISSRAI